MQRTRSASHDANLKYKRPSPAAPFVLDLIIYSKASTQSLIYLFNQRHTSIQRSLNAIHVITTAYLHSKHRNHGCHHIYTGYGQLLLVVCTYFLAFPLFLISYFLSLPPSLPLFSLTYSLLASVPQERQ